jgi:peptidoglycan/xylan/chitin deacetylase (PgdA/CDA1 family)
MAERRAVPDGVRASALMYHDVLAPSGAASGFGDSGSRVYSVTEAAYAEQLAGIAARVGAAPAVAADLLAASPPRAPWLITFDDGGASATAAGAALAARGWRGHFLVPTDYVGRPGFADAAALRELAAQGHVVGSHSASHPPRISECAPDALRGEWERSVAVLGEILGAPVTAASVPGGYYSEAVGRAAAAAGITVLFTSEPVRALDAIDGCLLVGRYAIRATSSTRDVVGAAAGERRPWLVQSASWSARRLAKRTGGRHYERLRTLLLDRRGG